MYFANSEDPDELPHNTAFNWGLHHLFRQESSGKEIQFFLIITCDPFIYAMDHPIVIVSNQKEESIRT